MLTKDQFAHALIERFRIEEELKSVDEISQHDILKSSCLAVGMERLGMLTEKSLVEYAASRGGSVFIYAKEGDVEFLTAREIMEMLPD